MNRFLPFAVLPLIAACAQSPSAIAPVSMGNAYDRITCDEARQMLDAEKPALDAAIARQNAQRTADGINIVLFGVFGAAANAMVGGDEAGTIAASKGKVLALEARIAGCRQ